MSVVRVKLAAPKLKLRTSVVEDQYALFLIVSGVPDYEREKLLDAIRSREIEAIGLFLVDKTGKRIAEIELSADWKKHQEFMTMESEYIDLNDPFFTPDGYAVEPYIAAGNLVKLAQEQGLAVRLWIRVTTAFPENRRTAIYRRLGYTSSVPGWKSNPQVDRRNLASLQELTLTNRQI